MADWFKVYEDGLNCDKMIYLQSANNASYTVWSWILIQCCRKKSDTFNYTNFDLIGISRKINFDVDCINCAIELLVDVGYIEVTDDSIKVLKWSKLQSDYCKKHNKCKNDTLINSDKDPLEESRGDKKYSGQGWVQFWNVYPNRVGKSKAWDSWKKKKCENLWKVIIAAVEAQKLTDQWFKDEGKFIPHPATWLNQERWEDEVPKYKVDPITGKRRLVTNGN